MADPRAAEYLVQKDVEKLFETMMESLVLDQPSDPRAYLANLLAHRTVLNFDDLSHILEAFKLVSAAQSPYEASLRTIDSVCSLLHCERASLFLYNPFHNNLQMVVGKAAKGLVLPAGSGFTWKVFLSCRTSLIQDAYSDSEFDASIDLTTGFKTKNMLGTPIKDLKGNTIGVLLALNKQTGNFSMKDEKISEQLAQLSGILIQNSIFYSKSLNNEKKVKAMLMFLRQILRDKPGQSLAVELVDKAKDLLQAETCHIFMSDYQHEALIPIASDSTLKFSLSLNSGPWAESVKTGQLINLDNNDPRFSAEFDEKFRIKTETMLIVPIKVNTKVIGIILVTNKLSDSMFGDLRIYSKFELDDSELLSTFAEILAKRLEKLFNSCVGGENVKNETVVNFSSGFGRIRNKSREDLPEGAIRESVEEEEGKGLD
jgi:GAF domain-containing protein